MDFLVVKNGGSTGIDGMGVEEGRAYFFKHKEEIIAKVKTRTYKPKPVKRVEIQKPDGGVRNSGVPCVIDRFILPIKTGTIYVEISYAYTYDFIISTGDNLQVLGFIEYYDNQNITPVIRCNGILKPTGSTGSVINNAEIYDTDDILDIDYTILREYTKFISFTGVVVFTGNTWYPSYGIVDSNMNTNYIIELMGPTYEPFNEMMYGLLGRIITIEGWLIFNSTYVRFEWELVYKTHVVIN